MICACCEAEIAIDARFCCLCGHPTISLALASSVAATRLAWAQWSGSAVAEARGHRPRFHVAVAAVMLVCAVLTGVALVRGVQIIERVASKDRRADERERETSPPADSCPADRATVATTGPDAVVVAETRGVVSAELATGEWDGRVARVRPGGRLTLAFPAGGAVTDDGTAAPDLAVNGVAVGPVSYRLEVRRPDGGYVRIDTKTRFGESDMHQHRVRSAEVVRITNTGTTDLFVDAVEAVRGLAPR